LLALTGVTYDGFSMAFQALLFCPDDKTARTVTQVLSELEFNVESCTEPFAAVKKLMSGHFDALVVDCDNEQNATLLFKSARNSTSNQTSLAVAIVEGQAGVAKAFRIGANLVLTKPINVEQSKGTLRVARGLLRKGEPGKPSASGATAAPVPAAKAVPTKPAPPAKPAATTAPAATPAAASRRPITPMAVKPPESVAAAQAAASSGLAEPDDILEIRTPDPVGKPAAPVSNPITAPAPPVSKIPAVPPAGSFGGGAASAPAPAREAQVHHPQATPASAAHEAEDLLEKPAGAGESTPSPVAAEPATAPAPSFAFGGANAAEETDGARKKIFIGIAAVVLLGALAYAGWSHFKGSASQPSSQVPIAVPASTAASTAAPGSSKPAPEKPAATVPSPSGQGAAPPVEVSPTPTNTAAGDEAAADESAPVESHNSAKSSTSSTSPASKSAAPAKPAQTPLVVKGGSVPKAKAQPAAPDAPAPNVIAIADPGSGGALSNLVGSGDTTPKPVLQSVNVSQGVSQGLLTKRVQPVYPKTALAMHVEGVVELMATVSKSGNITSVKVLKGDPQLTRAAADAVKQWKYEPYLLNGEPVEIQTQVTVTFKLPN
jgi:TonB family protein